MKNALLLLTALLLAKCQPKITESLLTTSKETIRDSIQEKDSVAYRDSLLKVKGATATITGQVKEDKNGKVNLPEVTTETERSKTSVLITDGNLRVNCVCKDLELRLKLKESYIRRLETRKENSHLEKTIYQVKEVRYVPKAVKSLAWVGGISILLVIILIIYKLQKLLKF